VNDYDFINEKKEEYHEELCHLKQLSQPACDDTIICYHSNFELDNGEYIILTLYKDQYQTLDSVIKETENGVLKKVDILRILDIMKQILSSLEIMHNKGIVHRDIKPLNILYKSNRDANEIILIDLGISCQLCNENSCKICDKENKEGCYCFTCENKQKLIATGELYAIGSPGYIPPEIALFDEAYDYKLSDIYSVGITFFELLEGHIPYKDKNYMTITTTLVNSGLPQMSFSKVKKIDEATKAKLTELIGKMIYFKFDSEPLKGRIPIGDAINEINNIITSLQLSQHGGLCFNKNDILNTYLNKISHYEKLKHNLQTQYKIDKYKYKYNKMMQTSINHFE